MLESLGVGETLDRLNCAIDFESQWLDAAQRCAMRLDASLERI